MCEGGGSTAIIAQNELAAEENSVIGARRNETGCPWPLITKLQHAERQLQTEVGAFSGKAWKSQAFGFGDGCVK